MCVCRGGGDSELEEGDKGEPGQASGGPLAGATESGKAEKERESSTQRP